MPWASPKCTAWSRHSRCTGHSRQIALARASRTSRSSRRSVLDGGKNRAVSGPRHAARVRHVSSVLTTTDSPPPIQSVSRRGNYSDGLRRDKSESSFLRFGPPVAGSLPVVLGCALGGLDLQDQPLDRRHLHRLACLDGGGAVGAG